MKKEFSFYEFVGIIVPSVILLFFVEYILETVYRITLFDFSKIGESVVFVVVGYGLGHMLQALGYGLEKILWWFFNGKPSNWLYFTPKSKFQTLFDSKTKEKILSKIHNKFGKSDNKNYAHNIYVLLFHKKLTDRIDIFNGNYSLFRGLSIAFIISTILFSLYYRNWVFLIFLALAIVAIIRMVHFAKLYARELFQTFMTMDEIKENHQ